MRIVLGVNKDTNIKKMLEALGWMSVKQIMVYRSCILIKKMLLGMTPPCLKISWFWLVINTIIIRGREMNYRFGTPELTLPREVSCTEDLNGTMVFLTVSGAKTG